jgi:tetratricopeptide (TPR) repeat protein
LFTLVVLVEARTRAFIRFLIELREDKKTGKVFVTSEGVEYVLHVRNGAVVFAEEPGGEPIGRLMVRKNLLTQEQYVDVVEQVSEALGLGERLRFGEAAVQLGFVTQAQVRTALEEQIRWRAARVIQRKEPMHRFDDAAPDTDKAHTLSMSIEGLILDAIRWMDDDRKDALVLSVAKNFALETTWPAREIDKLFGLTRDEREFLREALRGNCTVLDMCSSEVPDGVDPYALVTAVLVTGAVHTRERTSTADVLERISSPQLDPTPPPAPIIQDKPTDWNAVDSEKAKGALAKVQLVRKSSAELKAVDPSAVPVISAESKSLRAESAFQRARSSLKTGAHGLALKAVEEALSLQPDSKEYGLYAQWLRVVEAGGKPTAEEQAELETLAVAAEAHNPNLAFAAFVRGELLRYRGDTAAAYKRRKHALKLDPDVYTGASLTSAPAAAVEPVAAAAPVAVAPPAAVEPVAAAAPVAVAPVPAAEAAPAAEAPAEVPPLAVATATTDAAHAAETIEPLVPEPAKPAREPSAAETAPTEPPPPPMPEATEAPVAAKPTEEPAVDESADTKAPADEVPGTPEPVEPSPKPAAAAAVPAAPKKTQPARAPSTRKTASDNGAAQRKRIVGILTGGMVLSGAALALAFWVRSTAPSTIAKPVASHPVLSTASGSPSAKSSAQPPPPAADAGTATPVGSTDAGGTDASSHTADASTTASGTTGAVRLPPRSAGRRIYLDGKLWGEAKDTIELSCGKHIMRIGSKGDDRSLVVPCDGSELVLK